ncbi:MAG: dihydrofolate reductase family protein [Tannerellaceae bacterium]|jgi:dihydrofolate reductase|nr:dihydrofolate reductase family protein [Tannerellaceae bacterium]
MKTLKLLAPVSIDGYSSRVNIDMDWLRTEVENPLNDPTLTAFFDSIDCVVMNRMQYMSLRCQRYPFPIRNKPCFVLAGHDAPIPLDGGFARMNLLTANEERGKGALEHIRDLQRTPGEGDIWVMGDFRLIAPLLQNDMIDEINILRVPILLGTGISFLSGFGNESHWSLVKTQQYPTGAILSRYCRTNEALAV